MPDWKDLLDELKEAGSNFDIIRRKYLKNLHELTGRNVIIYYSGWLQKPQLPFEFGINDSDKTGFMNAIHRLDPKLGLDLILHTPGGETAATESVVDYLQKVFGTNIRAIVPQIAMSGGTMIACACNSILMGRQSSLGPIDPQFHGLPAHGVIEEFETAYKECKADQTKVYLWQPIIAKYSPTLIGECQKAIAWAEEMVKEWLLSGMLKDEENSAQKADSIVKELSSHALTKSHARHLSASKCKEIGLKIEMMEDSDKLQDAVLSIHHACIHTLTSTNAVKITENHLGKAFVQMVAPVLVPTRTEST